SMVIAPLIGPAMATSVGTVVDDDELFARGVRLQVYGIVLAVGSAAAFALLVKELHLVPPGVDVTQIAEVRERLTPDFLSLAVAIGAGVAGVVSLSTGVSTALVGVMIAVALMPPAATVGIGIAWGLPEVALGSGVLALVNWLSINFAALVVLWYQGYRPTHWFRLDEARTATLERVALLLFAIALLSVFLGGVTYTSFQHANFEQQARQQARDVVSEHEGLDLFEVRAVYDQRVLFSQPRRVVVVVGHPPGTALPPLAEPIERRLDANRQVRVEVRFVATETAG
ncbi:MAG: TIGR00341 family protein, partial [Halobacteriaceae archaeon]